MARTYSAAEYDVLMKAVVLGDSGVGKTSLLHRYTENDWSPTYIATIGVDFKIDTFETQGKIVKLQLWDTAGQERFKTICAAYYRGAHCIMLVYDVTNRESFENVRQWIKEVENYARANVPMLLVGNKADLGGRQVTREEAEEFARANGMDAVETSAKTASGVQAAFRKAVDDALTSRMELLQDEARERRKRLTYANHEEIGKKSCFQRFRFLLGL